MKKLTLGEVQSRSDKIHNNKFIIHSIETKEYGNCGYKRAYIDVECKDCGFRKLTELSNHTNGRNGCMRCSYNMYTLEYVRKESVLVHGELFKIYDIKMLKMNGDKKRSRSYVDLECNICGFRSLVLVHNHINKKIGCGGNFCKYQVNRKIQIKILKNNPDLANQFYTLYFLKFIHKITDEQFYKVGITKHSIKRRFSGKLYSDYIIKECQVVKGTHLWAVEQEDDFINKYYDKYSYVPRKKIRGWTECFRINISNEFKEV
jgi:hypothetical protein